MKPKTLLWRIFRRLLSLGLVAVVVFFLVDRGSVWLGKYLYPQSYKEQVTKYAEEYGVDQNLIFAFIKCESNFNPDANSDAGAKGLMQLTDDTFLWISQKIYSNPLDASLIYDPETNIRCGVWYISYLQQQFSGEREVIAAYNAGPAKVKEWLSDSRYSADGVTLSETPFRETENHIKKVQKAKSRYIKLYKEPR